VESSDFELFYAIDKAYFVLIVSPYQVNGQRKNTYGMLRVVAGRMTCGQTYFRLRHHFQMALGSHFSLSIVFQGDEALFGREGSRSLGQI
jgi:hypothetical protein